MRASSSARDVTASLSRWYTAATETPCSARARTIARPIPREPPVTTARLPFRSRSMFRRSASPDVGTRLDLPRGLLFLEHRLRVLFLGLGVEHGTAEEVDLIVLRLVSAREVLAELGDGLLVVLGFRARDEGFLHVPQRDRERLARLAVDHRDDTRESVAGHGDRKHVRTPEIQTLLDLALRGLHVADASEHSSLLEIDCYATEPIASLSACTAPGILTFLSRCRRLDRLVT